MLRERGSTHHTREEGSCEREERESMSDGDQCSEEKYSRGQGYGAPGWRHQRLPLEPEWSPKASLEGRV